MDESHPTFPSEAVSLTSTWFIQPGHEAHVWAGLRELAEKVKANEPDTLAYLVHSPFEGSELQSCPPPTPQAVLFVEMYRDADAFERHVNGPTFAWFVQTYGGSFVQSGAKPYTTVQFLTRETGFLRPESQR